MVEIPPDVQIGDPIRAEDWNRHNEALHITTSIATSRGIRAVVSPVGVVLSNSDSIIAQFQEPSIIAKAANYGTETLRVFEPAGVRGQVVWKGGEDERQYHRVLNIAAPDEVHQGQFVVCVDEIPRDAEGRVWVSGICPVWLARDYKVAQQWANISTPTAAGARHEHVFADVYGCGQILWEEDIADEAIRHLAVIRIGRRPITWIPIKNSAGEKIPAFSFVEADGSDEDDILKIKKPSDDSLTSSILLTGATEIQSGEVGFACGAFPLWVDYAGAAPSVGDERGTANGSWELTADKTGFEVLAVNTTDGVALVQRVAGGAAVWS